MKRRLIHFQYLWTLSRKSHSVCFGWDYNLWSPRGDNYSGTRIFTVHIAMITLRWYWERTVELKDL